MGKIMENINVALFSKKIQDFNEQGFDVKILRKALDNNELSRDEIKTIFDDFEYKADMIAEFKVRLYHLKNTSNEFMVSAIEAKMGSVDNFEHIIDSISRLEEGIAPDSPENIRSIYIKKIQNFKNHNYDITELEKNKNQNIVKFVLKVDEFDRGISIINDLRKRIEKLTFPALKKEVRRLMSDMRDPLLARGCLEKVIYFESLVADSKTFFEKRIEDFKGRGYNTEKLNDIFEMDFDTAYAKFSEFDKKISKYEKIKENLKAINCADTEENTKKLAELINDIKNFEEIEKLYSAIYKKIFKLKAPGLKICQQWGEQGFDISPFDKIKSLDYISFEKKIALFKKNIKEIELLKNRFLQLENPWFFEECKSVQALLFCPEQLAEIKENLKKLEHIMDESVRVYQGEAMNWKTQGFEIVELENLDNATLLEKLKIYHKIEEDLDLIPELRRKIDEIDNSVYTDKIKEIEENLKIPSYVHEAFRIIETLEESSVDKRDEIGVKFKKYKSLGYKMDLIEPYLESRLDILLEKWEIFNSNILILESIKEKLESNGATPFDDELEEVKFNIKDPSRASHVKAVFNKFTKKCEDYKDVYREKISDFKKMGFSVEAIIKTIDNDFLNVEKKFAEFEANVALCLELSEKLEKIDTSIFKSEAESIKEALKNVNEIEKAKIRFEKLDEIIKENKQALKDRIQGFSKRGYNIDSLLRKVDKPQKEILEAIREFEDSIEIVLRLKTEFEEIDRDFFSDESFEIEALLLRPLEHSTAKKKIANLENKVQNHKKNLRKKIYNLEAEGYEISQIRPFIHSILTVFSNQAELFFDQISTLKKIESSLFSIDSSIFQKHKKEILRLLKIPGFQNQAIKEIDLLKKRINSAREYYKNQIEFYKESGFRTDSLEKSMSQSLISVKETFVTFETRLPELISIKAEFHMLDHAEFPEISEQIMNLYTDPMSLNMLKDSMQNLKARIKNSKSLYIEYIEKMKNQGYSTAYLEKGISKSGSIRKIIKQEYKVLLLRLEDLKKEIFDLDSTYDYQLFSKFMEKTMDVDSISWLEKNLKKYKNKVDVIKLEFNEKISELWDLGFDITNFALKSSEVSVEQLKLLFNEYTNSASLMIDKINDIEKMDFSGFPEKKKNLLKLCENIENYEKVCSIVSQCALEIKKEKEKVRYRIKNIEAQGWNIDFFDGFEKMNIAECLNLLSIYENDLRECVALVKKISSMDFSLFPEIKIELMEKLKSPEYINNIKTDIEYYSKRIQSEKKRIAKKISEFDGFKTQSLLKKLMAANLELQTQIIDIFTGNSIKCLELSKKIKKDFPLDFSEMCRDILEFLTDPFNYDESEKLFIQRKKNYRAQHNKIIDELNNFIKEGWIFEIIKDFTICSVSELQALKSYVLDKINFSKQLSDKVDKTDFSVHQDMIEEIEYGLKRLDSLEKVEGELEKVEASNFKREESISKEVANIRAKYADLNNFIKKLASLSLKKKNECLEILKKKIAATELLLKKIGLLDLTIFDESFERVNKLAENPENIELIEIEYNKIIKKIKTRENNFINMIKKWENEGYDTSSLKLSKKCSLKLKEDILFDFEMLLPKVKIQIQRLDSIDVSMYDKEADLLRESLKNPFRLQECQLRIDALESAEKKLRELLDLMLKNYKKLGFVTVSLEQTERISLSTIIKKYNCFEQKIHKIEELKATYLTDDFYFFKQDLQIIKKLFITPEKIDLLENKMIALHNKCLEKREFLLKQIKIVFDTDLPKTLEKEKIDFSLYERRSLKELNEIFIDMEKKSKHLSELVIKIDKEDFSYFPEQFENLKNLCKSRFNIEKIIHKYELLKKEYSLHKENIEFSIKEYEKQGYFIDDLKLLFESSTQIKFMDYYNEFKSKIQKCVSLRKEINEKVKYNTFNNERERLLGLTFDVRKIDDVIRSISDFEKKIEKNISFYKRKIEALTKTGYNVKKLEKILLTGDFDKLEKYINIFENNVGVIERLKIEIEPLRSLLLINDFKKIQSLLNNPFEIEQIFELRDKLKVKSNKTLKKLLKNIYYLAKIGFHFEWISSVDSMGIDELFTNYQTALQLLHKRTSLIKSYRIIKNDISNTDKKLIKTIIKTKKLDSSLEEAIQKAGNLIIEERERYLGKIISFREMGYAFDFNYDESEFLSLDELKKIYEEFRQKIAENDKIAERLGEIDFSIQKRLEDELKLCLLDIRDTNKAKKCFNQILEYQNEFIISQNEKLSEFTDMGYDVSDFYSSPTETLAQKMKKITKLDDNIKAFNNIEQRLDNMTCEKFKLDIQVIKGFMKKPLHLSRVEAMTQDLEKRIENEIVKMKSRVRDYEFQGYNIETIIKYESKGYPFFKEKFEEFKSRISWLDNFKERIENIDEGIFEDKLNSLRSMLHDVTKIDEIENGIGEYLDLLELKRSQSRAKISIFTKKNYNVEQLLKTIDSRVGAFDSEFEDYLELVKKADLLYERLNRLDLEIFLDKREEAEKLICEIYNFEKASKYLYEVEYFLEAYVENIKTEVEEFQSKGYVKPNYIKCIYKKSSSIKEKKQAYEKFCSQINILRALLATLEGMDTSLYIESVNEIFPFFMNSSKIEYLNNRLDDLSKEILKGKEKLLNRIEEYKKVEVESAYFDSFENHTLLEIKDAFDLYDSLKDSIKDKKARLEIYTSYEEEKDQANEFIHKLNIIEGIEETIEQVDLFEKNAKGYYAMAIKRYMEKGYSVARLEAALPQTPDIVQSVFKSYESDLSVLQDAISYMESIDCNLYKNERAILGKISKNPSGSSKAARVVKEVREKEDKRRQSLIDKIETYRNEGFDVSTLDKKRGAAISELNESLLDFSTKADLLIEYRLYYDTCMRLVDFTSDYLFKDVDLISFGYIKVQLTGLDRSYYKIKKFKNTETEIQRIKSEVAQKISENIKKLYDKGYNITMFENTENLSFSKMVDEYIEFLKDLERLKELEKRLDDFENLANNPDYIMACAEIKNTVAIEFIEEKLALLADKGSLLSSVESTDQVSEAIRNEENNLEEISELAEKTISEVQTKIKSDVPSVKADDSSVQIDRAVEKEIFEQVEEEEQTEDDSKTKTPEMTDEMKRRFEDWKKQEQNK